MDTAKLAALSAAPRGFTASNLVTSKTRTEETNESVGKSVANKEKQRPLTVLIMCFILFSLATRRVSLHSTQLLLATNVQIKNFSMTEA